MKGGKAVTQQQQQQQSQESLKSQSRTKREDVPHYVLHVRRVAEGAALIGGTGASLCQHLCARAIGFDQKGVAIVPKAASVMQQSEQVSHSKQLCRASVHPGGPPARA